MERYTLASKPLQPGTQMNYCPYCFKVKKNQLKGTKKTVFDELDPLTYVKELQIIPLKNGEKKKYIDVFYTCETCHKKITDDDFVMAYCVDPDNNKYTSETIRKHSDITLQEIKQNA